MNKKCENCGLIFYCNANDIANCHCATVLLSPSALGLIKQEKRDCLCNDCLLLFQKKANKIDEKNNL